MTLFDWRYDKLRSSPIQSFYYFSLIDNLASILNSGILPKKYPANIKIKTQTTAPIALYIENLRKFIFPIPATKGAKVLNIGKNLENKIAFPPFFS